MILSSRISVRITGAKKGRPFGRRFFDSIPFSRIVEWGKGFFGVKKYVQQNILEAAGVISYRLRKGGGKQAPKCTIAARRSLKS